MAQHTAKKLQENENGWVVTSIETGKSFLVFCNLSNNTAEAAIDMVENPPQPDVSE
jgi:hypothetical protein